MTEFFTEVTERIPYEGPDSDNPLAFHWYDADRVVAGRRMEDHLRFAVCYWHSFNWDGFDIFGAGTLDRPWHPTFAPAADPIEAAKQKMDAAFEFFSKLGVPFYCFHDRDIAPEGASFKESVALLDEMVDYAAEHQQRTGVELLWGTANLFANPRYQAGAATNPDPEVFAYAAAQVAHCLEATHRLGGHNYVLWGGREGYETLLNTDIAPRARSTRPLPDDGRRAQATHRLRRHDPHRAEAVRADEAPVRLRRRRGRTRSCSATTSPTRSRSTSRSTTPRCRATTSPTRSPSPSTPGSSARSMRTPATTASAGISTASPVSVEQMTLGMVEILRGGGFTTGGLNFDAKLRRQSIDRTDLFHGHIGGMDTMARALLAADSVLAELDANRTARYAAWDGELGRSILDGTTDLAALHDRALDLGEPTRVSGGQERLENLVARHVARVR